MEFDCIIRGGRIADGTGTRPPFEADLGIDGDRIAAVGDLSGSEAGVTIDASDRIVSPGFIDVHVHSELSLVGGRDQMATVHEGITTHLLAPDGFSWAGLSPQRAREFWEYAHFAYGDLDPALNWPAIEDYLGMFDGNIPANVCPQVPHCALRLAVMGWEARTPDAAELKAMEGLTRQWMEAGAVALNLGLDYQPSANADFAELVALCKVAASYGGIYAAHLRYCDYGRGPAWDEIIELAGAAGIPVHVSHERVDEETLEKLDRVDREGVDLSFESYLYPAGMTHGVMMLPMKYQAGSLEEVLARLADPAVRAESLPAMSEKLGVRKGTQIISYTGSGRFLGMTLGEAAGSESKSCEEFLYDLIIEEAGIEMLIFPWQTPDQDDNDAILEATARHPRMMVASDGVYEVRHPHPRGVGCFVQFLRRYVRERAVLSVEEAVHKMSGFPAQRFRLKDRGIIAEGMAADIAVFDLATVADRATWSEPRELAIGVDDVIVNGICVKQGGVITGALPGQVVRRS